MSDDTKGKAGNSSLTNLAAAFVAVASASTAVASFSLIETGNRSIRYKSVAIDHKTVAVQHWTDSHSIRTQIAIAELQKKLQPNSTEPETDLKISTLRIRQQKAVEAARRLEIKADESDDRSDALLQPRLWQILGLIILQISVALGSITILVKSKPMLGLAVTSGLAGAASAIVGALI